MGREGEEREGTHEAPAVLLDDCERCERASATCSPSPISSRSARVAAQPDERGGRARRTVEVDRVARERVPVPGGVDRPPPELDRVLVRQVVVVAPARGGRRRQLELEGGEGGAVDAPVEDAVRERRARPDREEVASEPGPVAVDVEQLRALRVGRSERLSEPGSARLALLLPPRPTHRERERERTVLSQPQIIVPIERPIPLYE